MNYSIPGFYTNSTLSLSANISDLARLKLGWQNVAVSAKTALDKVDKATVSSLHKVGDLAGAIAGTLQRHVAGAVFDLAGNAIKQAMSADVQKREFEVLAGPQKAPGLYNDLAKFPGKRIFGDEIYNGAEQLLSLGTTVDAVIPSMKMLADISMGSKDRLKQLVNAYGEVNKAGRLTGNTLSQFISAGWNPLKEIHELKGTSIAGLAKIAEKGGLSAETINLALQHATGVGGRYYQMTENIAQSPYGQWEGLKGQVQESILQLGNSMLPMLNKIIPLLSSAADKLPKMIEELEPVFNRIGNIVVGLWPQIAALGKNLWEAAMPLIELLTSKEAESLLGGLLGLANELSKAVVPILKDLTGIIKPLAGALGGLLEMLNNGINTSLGGYIWDWATSIPGLHQTSQAISGGYNAIIHRNNPIWALTDAYTKDNTAKGIAQFLRGNLTPQQVKTLMASANKFKKVLGPEYANKYDEVKGFLYPSNNAKANYWAMGRGVTLPDMSKPGGPDTAITNGGSRPINIYLQREMVKVDEIHIQGGTRETVDDLKRIARQAFLEVLESAKANG